MKKLDIDIDLITRKDFEHNRPYVRDGESEEYSFGGIFTTQIIKQTDVNDLTVLDIGCGLEHKVPKYLNEIKLNPTKKIKAFGILSTTDAKLPDYVYISDAHFLSENKNFRSIEFDFIFSQMTFYHLVNPIKALEEAYKKLKPNGIMLISRP